MRGKIETTIPQRQFENIKTSYEFSTEEERKKAIEMAIKDCIELKDKVSTQLRETNYTKLGLEPHDVLKKLSKENTEKRKIWSFFEGSWHWKKGNLWYETPESPPDDAEIVKLDVK